MTSVKKLCLNMIVRNEMANLERCLSAVADHIACWVIGDTGSTDGTQDFIKSYFAKRDIPGELHSFPFMNFEQARNAALDCAYASPLVYDYLLLADADMELVVEDLSFREKLDASSYDLLQRSSISYWNKRIVRRDAGARYHGVTHEYLAVPDGGKQLPGVWYRDHASGSNRVDKFERDIRLLLEGLEQKPDNYRYWFYLAQSYRDAGQTAKAVEAYAKRAAMGGWDEEAWNARLHQARSLRQLGDDGGFLREALAAFNQRPQRAEPLYDLARYYRERGMNDASVLFCEAGLALPRPEQDILFLEDFVYTTGLKEEYSITANYSRDQARKDRGFDACNWLALNRDIPAGSRDLARQNIRFYVQSADKIMPSFTTRPVGFTPPDGYHPSNPSIARWGDEIVMVQRSINHTHTLTEDGQYYQTPNGVPCHTRNFLLHLNRNLEVESSAEILSPLDLPPPKSQRFLGFEDLRLFAWRGGLWCSATLSELTPETWCELVLARIDESGQGPCHLADWRVLHPEGPKRHEKNWMPLVTGEKLQFIYLCDPTRMLDEQAQTIVETTPVIAAEEFRGGSQAIAFDGGWLTLIHEVLVVDPDKQRIYHHRFVWFDEAGALRRVSRPFFFQRKGREFAAGLAWHPDGKSLLISYGVGNVKAWIATVDADEVRRVLDHTEKLPFFRDAGQTAKVAEAYAKRAAMGGGDEEAWNARLHQARSLRQLGDDGGFLREALAAFNQLPQRAEPLYDLARYYRERGMNDASVLFCEAGLALPRPEQDTLFLEDFVYTTGLKEEYSITANYSRDPARKDRGFDACNWLALNRDIPAGSRNLARKNIRFYVQSAHKIMPSFTTRPVGFTPPDGYHPSNPSIARWGDEIVMVQRSVNYTMVDGQYRTPNDAPVHTRNFLLRLTDKLDIKSAIEILPPADMPEPAFNPVLGFEDARLFAWRGALWCCATVRELMPDGLCEQVLARIDESGQGPSRLVDWRVLHAQAPRRHQKNWMPLVTDEKLKFIYLCDPTRILDEQAQTIVETTPAIAAEDFRGGSQAIAFDGGWLALIHEVLFVDPDKQRIYHHRFVWLDEAGVLRSVSRPFFFQKKGIEFAAGLAWHPDGKSLLISYGVGDGEAWIATVDADEVRRSLADTEQLGSGAKMPEVIRDSGEKSADFTAVRPQDIPSQTSIAPKARATSREQKLGSLGAESFLEQHAVGPARALRARLSEPPPRVLLAILAKQKEAALPLYLECIEALDYPKSAIFLYVRTNNNTDRTEHILREWVARVGHLYAGVEFDAEDVVQPVETYGVHEWNPVRFQVLGLLRNISLHKTLDHGSDFYFVADVDNFIRPCTLRELVALNLPVVAPFLRAIAPGAFYSNYHAETDAHGYYADCEQFYWALERRVRGVIEMPVVHCTYLVRADVIPDLTYEDGSDHHEYVRFSHNARQAGVLQYLDNRQVYGYITFEEGSDAAKKHFSSTIVGQIDMARDLLKLTLSSQDGAASDTLEAELAKV